MPKLPQRLVARQKEEGGNAGGTNLAQPVPSPRDHHCKHVRTNPPVKSKHYHNLCDQLNLLVRTALFVQIPTLDFGLIENITLPSQRHAYSGASARAVFNQGDCTAIAPHKALAVGFGSIIIHQCNSVRGEHLKSPIKLDVEHPSIPLFRNWVAGGDQHL